MVRTPSGPQDQNMTQTPHHEDSATTVTDPEHGPDHGGVNTTNLRDYGQLRRSVTDRKIAGVAGGLGRHLNVDPTVLRVAFVVLIFFGGAGLVVYAAAWLLVPQDGRDDATLRTSPGTRNVLLVIAGVIGALFLLGDSWDGGFGPPWPLIVLALLVFVVLLSRDRSGATVAPEASAASTQPPLAAPVKPDRGPKLFWVTLALVAVALGSLGLYETAGGAVMDAAYPALALTVVGAMLVLGAWVGRAGGLILLGVIASLALAVTAAGPQFEEGPSQIDASPADASLVRDRYYVPVGDLRLDLSGVSDIAEVEANAAEIEVIVPEGMTVDITANADVAGEITLLDQREEGPDVAIERRLDAGPGAPELDLDIRLLLGSVEVRQAG
jgi:phage shock protein PspC (stress-responsive transcriptional regulator)